MNFAQIEEKILKFWQEANIFQKSLERNRSKKNFVFFEGPPTANGRPGIHHVEARAFKDVIPRFKTMQGFFVDRKAGWDTHGLPVELQVEKELGLKNKKDIEKYGIEKFNRKCKESVWRYKDEWEKLTQRIAYWVDLKEPYVTYENYFIASIWQILKKVWDKKLIYKGFKIVPHCPRCGTGLSSHEVAQGYKKIKENSIYVKFPVAGEPNTYFLVWTTTPWTLPANVGLAVNPKVDYCQIAGQDQAATFILAKDRLEVLNFEYKIDKEIKGEELLGKKYESLFKNPGQKENDLKVIAGEFVSTQEGTGIVHLAPAYGEDDMTAGEKEGLSVIHTVDKEGVIMSGFDIPGEGKFVKDADQDIIDDLKKRNLLLKEEVYEHDYPFCWRCDSPLLYYAKESWFIKMSQLRKDLVVNNQKINWEPAYIKDGRFGEFIKEAKDWALSRERYWGTPLPVWQCEQCGRQEMIGSPEELKKQTVSSGNKYFLMRHGQAENNVQNILNGNIKTNHLALTKTGQEQVRQAASKLAKEKIDLIFASDFLRTKQTAEIVAEETGLDKDKIIFDERIREINTGVLDGQDSEKYVGFAGLEERFNLAPENGETLNELKNRVSGFLYELEQKYQGKNILIVSHEFSLWLMEVGSLGLTPGEAVDLVRIENGEENFLENAEFKKIDFIPLPHNQNFELDLHRPYIDDLELACECGGKMWREKDVLDVWFDSGSMPFAQWGYPQKEGSEVEFKEHYPADYICEAIDQTRGWFYTLLAIATLMEYCGVTKEGAPYKNVICLGHVLDAQGKKMSKSKGNVVDPWEMCEKFGADTLRWYLYTVNQAGDSKRFDVKDVLDKNRRIFGTLLNSFVFLQTYQDKKFKPGETKSKNLLDRWIVSRFNSLTAAVTDNLEKYDVVGAARLIEEFIDELSNWYIRRSRERFQKPKDAKEKEEATQTLHFVLLELVKLMAPFAPFLTEEIYQNLKTEQNEESVHLCDYPKDDKKLIDEKLEKEMILAREIVAQALAKRAEAGVKIRQPLAGLTVEEKLDEEFLALVADEVNVKKIQTGESFVLDLEMTDELKREGIKREVERHYAQMRKELGLKPEDTVDILALSDDSIFADEQSSVWRAEQTGAFEEAGRYDVVSEVKVDNGVIKIGIKK